MILESNMMDTFKVERTKAYRSGMAFVISSLKTHAEKLNLIVLY